jgi:hypothetical protein
LRFGEQERAQPVGLRGQLVDLGAQLALVPRRAGAVAHQKDRGDHGEAEQRQCGGQYREFLVIEIEPVGDGIGDAEVCGKRGTSRQQGRKGESNQAVARQ